MARVPLRGITRRDFLNGVLVGAGASLLGQSAPGAGTASAHPAAGWYGYGGVGDYAPSHGNTPQALAHAHALRDGRYRDLHPAQVRGSAEIWDLVVVGAGMAGLGAAFEFAEVRAANQRCLIIDNHPLFGGEAKRNEFSVGGERLIAPQGSNGFSVPGVDAGAHAQGDARYYDALGVPRRFHYAEYTGTRADLRFGTDHYGFLYWLEHTASVGYFFPALAERGASPWVRDPWRQALHGTPWPDATRQELLRWRSDLRVPEVAGEVQRWLDGMSYEQYLREVLGYGPAPARYADPILASAVGLGADAVSAYAAYAILMPGTLGLYPQEARDFDAFERHSFPGGNDGFARCFLKRIIPQAIAGADRFEDIVTGAIDFAALDRPGQPLCMRLGATVIAVAHERDPQRSDFVDVVYVRDGEPVRVRARAVVMAGGAWMNKHVVRDLPPAQQAACASLRHAPFLVANVALTNWRFMHERGISACRYEGDFGFACNIRRPMHIGAYQPPLDPDRPTVLTFYVPFIDPGAAVGAQVAAGRAELLATSYARYERRIVDQMQQLFGRHFDARRDLAGIVLNRWGHAFVVPEPGFYFGRGGTPAAREVLARRHGRIAFGHSELRGNQHWGPAAEEGRRACLQLRDLLS